MAAILRRNGKQEGRSCSPGFILATEYLASNYTVNHAGRRSIRGSRESLKRGIYRHLQKSFRPSQQTRPGNPAGSSIKPGRAARFRIALRATPHRSH